MLTLQWEQRVVGTRRCGRNPGSAVLLLALICCAGCADQNAQPVADNSGDQAPDHSGESHGDHSHQHGPVEPLYGGEIVAIGHTHHDNGVTHIHAEVMPLEGDIIRLHVLTDSADGELEPCPVDSKEMKALISVLGEASVIAESSLVVAGDDSAASEYSIEIPEDLVDKAGYSVVIPKIVVGGQRQNFSFRVQRQAVEADAADSADAAEDIHE